MEGSVPGSFHLRDDHHHANADNQSDDLFDRLPQAAVGQQLGDHAHGGDVDEATGCERQHPRRRRRLYKTYWG